MSYLARTFPTPRDPPSPCPKCHQKDHQATGYPIVHQFSRPSIPPMPWVDLPELAVEDCIESSIDRHVCCYYIVAIVNQAPIKMKVQISFSYIHFISYRRISRSCILLPRKTIITCFLLIVDVNIVGIKIVWMLYHGI